MTQTRKAIRTAWDKANLKKYTVHLHRTTDRTLIQYVERLKASGIKTTDIFRQAVDALIEKDTAGK